jgi:MFS transporter, ACS family, DAL5 transporter family protein
MTSPWLWPTRIPSAARLEGFEEDLHLTGQQFNTLLGVLYVGYILMQIPS